MNPSPRWLERLPLGRKMTLISLLFLVPIAALLALLAQARLQSLAGAEGPLEGARTSNAYRRVALPLAQGLKALQTPADRRGGDATATLSLLDSALPQSLDRLEALAEGARRRAGSDGGYAAVREAWERSQALRQGGTPTAPESLYLDLLGRLSGMLPRLAQDGAWGVDPDPATSPLTDTVLVRLPRLFDGLRELDALAQGGRGGALGDTDRTRMTVVEGLVDMELEAMDRDLDMAGKVGEGAARDPALAKAWDDLRQTVDRYRNTLVSIRDGKPQADLADTRYRESLDKLDAFWAGACRRLTGALEARAGGLRTQSALVAALVLLLVGATFALALWLANSVTRPIRELTEAVERVIQQGDLTRRLDSTRTDEVGQLARSFDNLIDRLRQVPLSLGRSLSLLSGSVRELEQSLAEQSAGAEKQAAALQETQATAHQIRQTSQTADERARDVLKAAEQADQHSRRGAQALDDTMRGMVEIRSQVEGLRGRVGTLAEQARQIEEIIDTVKDLADQSNMLALNAGIEAVRSGEHGRGFALVAREIRSLADQSVQATARVREVLGSLTRAMESAAEVSESGARKVEDGLTQVRASAGELKALTEIVRDDARHVRDIATAVHQQNAGIAQIFVALTGQNRLMEEGHARMERSLASLQSLSKASAMVDEVVGGFKI